MEGDKDQVQRFLRRLISALVDTQQQWAAAGRAYLPGRPIVRISGAHGRQRIEFDGAVALQQVVPVLLGEMDGLVLVEIGAMRLGMLEVGTLRRAQGHGIFVIFGNLWLRHGGPGLLSVLGWGKGGAAVVV